MSTDHWTLHAHIAHQRLARWTSNTRLAASRRGFAASCIDRQAMWFRARSRAFLNGALR